MDSQVTDAVSIDFHAIRVDEGVCRLKNAPENRCRTVAEVALFCYIAVHYHFSIYPRNAVCVQQRTFPFSL